MIGFLSRSMILCVNACSSSSSLFIRGVFGQNGGSTSRSGSGTPARRGALIDACGTPVWLGTGSLGVAAAPSLLPKSCMFSPTTRNLERFWPVCLSSQVSSWSRPSMNTGEPLWRYCFAISAVRPHRSTSTKVTSSRFCRSSVQVRLTATPISESAVPWAWNEFRGHG